jgi:hypothetical protein
MEAKRMKAKWIALTVVAAAAVVALAVVFTRGEGTQAGSQAGLVMEGGGGDLSPYLVGYYRCVSYDGVLTDGDALPAQDGLPCGLVNTVFHFINPTSELLQKDAALFDADENLVGCFSGLLTQNDLEIDNLSYMLGAVELGSLSALNSDQMIDVRDITLNGEPVTELPEEGVIKVVVLDPTIPNAVDALRSGLVGYADYHTGLDADGIAIEDVPTGLAELHSVPRQVLLEDAYGGPNQDQPGPDGRPDELAKIIDGCFPPPGTPTPTVTPTVTNTPTVTPTVPTATPTSTPTPFVPVVTSTPTATSTSETGGTCFEWPPGSGTIICFGVDGDGTF